MSPPMFVIVKTEFPAPSQLPVIVMLGGAGVSVEVLVIVGVGVTQKAVALATSTASASLIVTMIAPYNPLIESVILWPEVSNPVGPLVRKTLFWNKFQE